MKNATSCCVAALICLFFFSAGFAQTASSSVSGEFSLQGRLTTTTGATVADGAHTLVANIYSKATGALAYTETQTITTVDGYFSTMVGSKGTDSLRVNASTDYELGITIDGQSELAPRLSLAGSLKSLTAEVAANANAVGGFGVSTADSAKPNTLLVLNGSGKIHGSLLDSGLVTSVNGLSGAVNFQGGGDLSVNTQGNTISLSFSGSGGGGLSLPFTKSVDLSSGSAFSITNTLGGSAASFINTGLGAAVNATASTGAAIMATSSAASQATLDLHNSAGAAINAVANASGTAALTIKNEASDATAKLMSAVNASNTTVLDVATNGKTTIQSTVGDALEVSTSAAGEAALKVTGGLKLIGAVGSGQINLGQTTTTITNALVKANSIIMITTTGAGSLTLPLQIASQSNGSFVVSVLSGILSGAVTGNVTFNYLIINQ